MKYLVLLFSIFFSHEVFAQQPSGVWQPDCNDGTYKNPVLYADYSDPDVCAVDGDYYLTASSFSCVPGLPILHSRDMVNWRIVGHALKVLSPAADFTKPQHGKGVWAPSIRYHDGLFYIFWGDPDRGIFMVSASRAEGPWRQPVCVVEGCGMIDPCPLWDKDGRCYLVNGWAASRAGFNSVLTVRELSPDATHAIGQPCIVFDGGQENHTTEGPKFYLHDGYYWIFCPAGGVQMGWQLAMRSRSPFGPYEWRKVLQQGSTDINGPHQGAWVHTPYDEDWFLHFNDKGAYGRVVFLQPMKWVGGWPVMGDNGEPVIRWEKPRSDNHQLQNPQASDEFDTPELGLQWQWQANYNPCFGMPTSQGFMRLYTFETDRLWDAPNLLLQKLSAPQFTATAKVRFAAKENGQCGGLVMMGMDYEALFLECCDDHFQLKRVSCKDADKGGQESVAYIATFNPTERDTILYSPALYLDIYLRVTVQNGKCRWAYSTDGRRYHKINGDFTLRQGKWIGAKIGFAATCRNRKANRGWLDVDWIRFGELR